jgi:hypothetical protein
MTISIDPESFLPLYATAGEIDALQQAVQFFQEALKSDLQDTSQRMRLLYRLDCLKMSIARQLQELSVLASIVQEQRPLLPQALHVLSKQNNVYKLYQTACQRQDEETIQWTTLEMQTNHYWFAHCGFELRFAECLQQWVLSVEENSDGLV